MPLSKTAFGSWGLVTALCLLGLAPGCDSGTQKPDAGSGGGGQTGTAGSTGTGKAGTTGTGSAGATGSGNAGITGAAGTHAARDGGACICAAIYAPVCGVDGKTYASKCAADCAGVVAHDGECTTPAKDASTDGPPLGYCDLDTDCISRYSTNCSCTQLCVAKTDPVPPPPTTVCRQVCPAIAITCSCVNHQCAHAVMAGAGAN